jgi:hypothetical protein
MSLLFVLCSFSSENKSAYYPLPIVRLLHLESFRSVVIFIFLSLRFFFVTFFFFSFLVSNFVSSTHSQSMTDRSHHDTYIVDGCPRVSICALLPYPPVPRSPVLTRPLHTCTYAPSSYVCLLTNEHHHHPTHGSHTPTNKQSITHNPSQSRSPAISISSIFFFFT